jgi:hypothetical protein
MAKQTQSEQSQKTEKPLKTLVKSMIAKDSKKAFYNFQACALNHSAISPTVD